MRRAEDVAPYQVSCPTTARRAEDVAPYQVSRPTTARRAEDVAPDFPLSVP